MNVHLPFGSRRPASAKGIALIAAGLVVAVGAATTVFWVAASSRASTDGHNIAVETTPAPLPTVAVGGVGDDGKLPYAGVLHLTAANGTIQSVSSNDPTADPLTGTVGADGSWTSTSPLFPATTYNLDAAVLDTAGDAHVLPVTATTTEASTVLTAQVSPGDGKIVGVGQPVIVKLDRKVKTKADRAEVERRLLVTTTPAVVGSWRWMSDSELHYRAATFWAANTQIHVVANLQGARLSGGIFGSGSLISNFSIGDAITAVADVQAHTVTVSQNGTVLKVLPASMGKPGFDTRGGTFLVLEKFADKVMDSETLTLPAGTPGYRTAVKWAVRISNSGTFTHGAPWSVKSQGKANVSHGCINLSDENAKWFYDLVKRGDVVSVVNATTGPLSYDAGSQDWNMTFAQWSAGSAL